MLVMQKKGKIKITIKRLLRACLIDQTLLVGRSSEEQERTDILYREIVLSKGLGIIINNKVTFLINIVNQKIHPTIYCIKLLLSFFIFCTSLTIVLSINIWFKWEGEEDKFLFLFGDLIKKKNIYKYKYFPATVAAGCWRETQQPIQRSEDSNVRGVFTEENFLSKLP